MEISESAWAKANAISNMIDWHDSRLSDAEIIARLIMEERRECADIASSMAAEIGKEPSSDGDRWSGVIDASARISQAIRNK